MGFFDFLKKKGPETISFSQVEAWLDKQVADKKLGENVSRVKGVINSKILESHRLLDELEKAGLRNENIPVKAKQIMEGHRRAYIQRLKRFLDEIEVPDDFSQIGFYSANFSELLDKLSRETQKNYFVLKEFLEAELSRVVKSIKSIEDELVKLQQNIEKQGIDLVKDAKVRLKQYRDDLKKKAMLEEEKIKQSDELENLKERRHKLAARLDELQKTNEYNEFKELLDNKKKYEDELREIETELKTIFAELNRPLRKYKHRSLQEKLIDKYLLDPAGALEDDASMVMLEVLAKMKQELPNLELKENQLEKASEMINKLTRNFFMDKKFRIDRLKELNKEAATKINNSVVTLNIAENETLLRGVGEKITQAGRSLEEVKKVIDEINLDYLKQKAKEKIKEISPGIIIKDD
jgi:hypothetical protein